MEHESGWKRRLRAMARRAVLPHAVILTGADEVKEGAGFLCAAMLCAQADKPCLHCPACRKVLSGIHPDVRLVDDPDHKELSMELVRAVRQDVYIRPNEGARKIFVFPDSARLNERDQNVLLKIVEEGPSYAAFVFCATSAALLLPTIRSRCVEINLRVPGESFTPSEDAETLCRLLCQGDVLSLAAFLVALENRRIKREELQAVLRDAWRLCAAALLLQSGKPLHADAPPPALCDRLCRCFSAGELNALAELLRRCGDECNFNVGAPHVLGALLAGWESLYKKG